MKVLGPVQPTAEQLTIINDHKLGTTLITGAAGSGKTTTALLRLKQESRFWLRRSRDGHILGAPRILVLTYNRTLKGYIEALVAAQAGGGVDVEVSTFGRWAWNLLGKPTIVQAPTASAVLANFGSPLRFPERFLHDEIDYILGRLEHRRLDTYADPAFRRLGRGATPRVDQAMRGRILNEVVIPYQRWKQASSVIDWNDVAVLAASAPITNAYHVVIVDEAQDFSANQVRAIQRHLSPEHSQTFILDRAQNIYARHFTWREVGIAIVARHRLERNFRNTAEIAKFASPLVANLDHGDDSAIPDFSKCIGSGDVPVVVAGRFSFQAARVVRDIAQRTAGNNDSVAILHAAGGGWFDEMRRQLVAAGLPFVEISQMADWPTGREQIALSTMHSAKGLEFDHVYIVGLNADVTPHGHEPGDSMLETYQRLLAMAIGRAAKSVMVGYKPSEASSLVALLDPTTYVMDSE